MEGSTVTTSLTQHHAPSTASAGALTNSAGPLTATCLGQMLDAYDSADPSAKNRPLLLDVRTPAEFTSAHIPGSQCVPLELLESADDESLRSDYSQAPVVIVCRSGRRAEQARERLLRAGVQTANILEGGILEFGKARPDRVRTGTTRWAMDRQVRMTAGSLVVLGFLGGRLVSPRIGYLAGAVGAGLTLSALTDSCMMASVLSKMPWNRVPANASTQRLVSEIPTVDLTDTELAPAPSRS